MENNFQPPTYNQTENNRERNNIPQENSFSQPSFYSQKPNKKKIIVFSILILILTGIVTLLAFKISKIKKIGEMFPTGPYTSPSPSPSRPAASRSPSPSPSGSCIVQKSGNCMRALGCQGYVVTTLRCKGPLQNGQCGNTSGGGATPYSIESSCIGSNDETFCAIAADCESIQIDIHTNLGNCQPDYDNGFIDYVTNENPGPNGNWICESLPSLSPSPSPSRSPSPSPSPNGSPSASPSPSPVLSCTSLRFDTINGQAVGNNSPQPNPGDIVTFACEDSGNQNYGPDLVEFRYQINGGNWQTLGQASLIYVQTSGLWTGFSQPLTVQPGNYIVQCRVCRQGTCTQWGQEL